MIDTHCHLTDRKLSGQVGEIVSEALENGVEKLIVPGGDVSDSREVIKLTKEYEQVYGLVGIYPGNVEGVEDIDKEMASLEEMTKESKIVGIGEIGLDCYWNERDLPKQIEVFRAQLELAIKLDLPVVIHTRKSGEQVKKVFESMERLPRGQFHCFGEGVELMEYFLDKGFYLSFCGNVTYKSAEDLREMAKRVPMERLLLETDAPYLTPEPIRGNVNRPANVRITAEFLAKLKEVSLGELAEKTTENAKRLFGI